MKTCLTGAAILCALASFGVALAADFGPSNSCGGPPTSLNYIHGSTVKIEQVIGDFDYAAAGDFEHPLKIVPTVSQTVTRSHVAGNGLGYSFEHNGNLIFLFGDTVSEDPTKPGLNFFASDPMAWSKTTSPDEGLLVNFFMQSDGLPLFVKPSPLPDGTVIKMGADEIPNSGISLNGQIYLVCNTGADKKSGLPNPHVGDFSVLVRFDQAAPTPFKTLRKISALDSTLVWNDPAQGHFIFTSLHECDDDVLAFGIGLHRQSDIYLARIPKSGFESGQGTRYLKGLGDHGEPLWSNRESDAHPIVFDNPQYAPPSAPWPNDNPTVGNLSVIYSTDLRLWLMTYDGGRQKGPNQDATEGIYFCYAPAPWGPWSEPQLIFNGFRDNGYGVFISNYDAAHPVGFPAGPVIGDTDLGDPTDPDDTDAVKESPDDNDPTTTRGGPFAPQMIERFTRVKGDTLSIYYSMSTWNPYTVLKMRSDFKITHPAIKLGLPVQLLDTGSASRRGELDMSGVPDMHLGVVQQLDKSYRVWISGTIGPNGGGSTGLLNTTDFISYAPVVGTPTHAQAVLSPAWDGVPGDSGMHEFDADYAGANTVFRANFGADLLMIYHGETRTFGGVTNAHVPYFAEIGLARSSDNGVTWKRQGAIISGTDQKPNLNPPNDANGVPEPGAIVAGDFLYVFYPYFPSGDGAPSTSTIQVARALRSTDGVPGSWSKYYQGSFGIEPGLRGRGDSIVPTVAGCTNPRQPWVSYSSCLHSYVMLFVANEGWFYSMSKNLLAWTAPVQFYDPPVPLFTPNGQNDDNLIFVTPGNQSQDIGQSGYVLYASTPSFGFTTGVNIPHELWLRPFTFTGGPRSEPDDGHVDFEK